jgi:hypothetical protein
LSASTSKLTDTSTKDNIMHKGFGTPKRPTEREIATLKALIRIRKDYESACAYRDKLVRKYGKERVIDEILTDDPQLFADYRNIMPQPLREKLDEFILPKAQEIMFQQFAEWGFEPGKDFSLGVQDGKQAMWIGEKIQARMEADGFPIRKELEKYGIEQPDPATQLDKHLGVPFTHSLIAALANEASTEDPKLTMTKVSYLVAGLTAANPQIEWLSLVVNGIIKHLGKPWGEQFISTYRAAGEFFDANPDADDDDWCSLPDKDWWWMALLSRALEIEIRHADLGNGTEEPTIGIEDCRKLHQVWRGERFTFLEMANALEKASEDYRNKGS